MSKNSTDNEIDINQKLPEELVPSNEVKPLKFELIELENLSTSITKEEIENFFISNNINHEGIEFIPLSNANVISIANREITEVISEANPLFHNVRVKIEADPLTLYKLEVLKKEKNFPGHSEQKIHIKYLLSYEGGLVIDKHPKEDSKIDYVLEYHKMIITDFERKEGSEGLIFTNKEIIDKQRSVMGYLIKKMGSNLLSGKSIMNVSLPINIFDVRSHIEVFASQTCYAPKFLEAAGATDVTDPIERLKLTTTFVMTTVHLAVAQLKPFNPILGETFQVKIEDSMVYIEQTSHHPPIFNFLFIGKNYKVYGHNESEVGSGANSVKAKYKGSYTVEYKDGVKHKVYFPEFKLSGLLFGNRSIKYFSNLVVTDEANDLMAFIIMDPDDRSFFKKIFTKKKITYPDYFKGVITNISKSAKFDKKDKTYSIVDMDKHVLCSIEGEYSNHIKFDNVGYWEYENCLHPEFRRMAYTLPSDSTFREDLNWLKKGNEEMSQKTKIKLEDIQRHEKKLREKENKKNIKDKKNKNI